MTPSWGRMLGRKESEIIKVRDIIFNQPCLFLLFPLLLFRPKQLVHYLDCTQIPAHRAGFHVPVAAVDLPCMVAKEGKSELFLPVKRMPGLGHLHLAFHPPAFVLPDSVPDVGSNFCYPRTLYNVSDIRQGEVFTGRNHAEEIGTVHACRCPPDGCHDVVIARRNIGDERSEQVERGMVGDLFYHPYIVAHLVEGHVTRPLYHPLDLSLIHISEPTRRTPISYAVFCLKKKKNKNK